MLSALKGTCSCHPTKSEIRNTTVDDEPRTQMSTWCSLPQPLHKFFGHYLGLMPKMRFSLALHRLQAQNLSLHLVLWW